MSMRAFNISLAVLFVLSAACRQDDRYLYEVNTLQLMASNDHKSREKSNDQYLATLYANLFQRSASGDELAKMKEVLSSIGDKELGRLMLVSNLIDEEDVKITSMSEMRSDMDSFIKETYRRFLLRDPSEAELIYLKSYLFKNPQLSPEMVYLSFVLSNEYQFY